MGGLIMKRIIVMMSIAASIAAVSCTKATPEQATGKGIPITIEVAAPEFDGNGEATDTKISFNGSNIKHKFDAGDYFRLYSCNSDGSVLTDWGRFTTDAGGAWARFHGEMPSNYTTADHGDMFRAIYHSGVLEEIVWTGSRYECKYNIPSVQDGTGLKYCLFCNSNDPTFNTETLALQLQFRCYNALCHLNLVGGDVRTIRVTVKHAKLDNFNLVSSGDKKDIVFNASGRALSGGGSKTLTINNNDQVLSGDIFFATRQTNGSATNGYASLTFEFINGSGEVCTKHLNLATGIDKDNGTATTYKNISNYFTLTKFGTVDLTSATFVAP